MKRGICVFVLGDEHREVGRKSVALDAETVKHRGKTYLVDWRFKAPFLDKKGRQLLFFDTETISPLLGYIDREITKEGKTTGATAGFMRSLRQSATAWESFVERGKMAQIISGGTKSMKNLDRGQVITYILLGGAVGVIVGVELARYIA